MKYSDIIRTANANLRKSKLRTILTISAVFIGSLTLMLTSGVGAGLTAYVQEQVDAAGAKDAIIVTAKSENQNPVSGPESKKYDQIQDLIRRL
jgi:putative ABC transport system permease protein